MNEEELKDLIEDFETLKLQQDRILQRLKAAQDSLPIKKVTSSNEGDALLSLKVGDRVRLHKTSNLFGRKPTEADRQAVVTGVAETKINITTDSGNRTWRKPKNLTKIPS